MVRWTFGLVLMFVAFSGAGAAGEYAFPPEVRGKLVATLDVGVPEPARAKIGAVALTVTVEGGKNLEVAAVRLDDPIDAWKAHSTSSWALDAERVTWSQCVELRQAKPGFPNLPAVTVRFRAGPAAPWEEATWVNILRAPREPPPPEPTALSGPSTLLWPFLVVGLMGSLIAAGWLRWRPRPTAAQSPVKAAWDELDAAEHAGLAPVELHQRLSELVRHYLAARWQLPAPRQTTAELLGMHVTGLPATARAVLGDFLEHCDLAKFAPLEPTPEQCRATVVLARSILKACEEQS